MSGDELGHLEDQFACNHDDTGRCDQTSLSMEMASTGQAVIIAHGDQKDVVKMAALLVAGLMDQIGVPRIMAAKYVLQAKRLPTPGDHANG